MPQEKDIRKKDKSNPMQDERKKGGQKSPGGKNDNVFREDKTKGGRHNITPRKTP